MNDGDPERLIADALRAQAVGSPYPDTRRLRIMSATPRPMAAWRLLLWAAALGLLAGIAVGVVTLVR
jgi:hypothetical protein